MTVGLDHSKLKARWEVKCICCDSPKGICQCAQHNRWASSIPLLTHIPCLLALMLPALGIGASFAASIHSLAPLFFCISLVCVIVSFMRWKRMDKLSRLITVGVAILVLMLWYPHRQHIWTTSISHEHMHHNH